ncbi:MAG: aminodeoxychorismate lyase [Pseudomonadales bacterium]
MSTQSNAGAVLVDGQPTQLVDSAQRALSYGDGLFETIRVVDGKPLLWGAHMARLKRGCLRLKISLPQAFEQHLLDDLTYLHKLTGLLSGTFKLTVSRGAGPRGYKFSDQLALCRITSLSPPASFSHQAIEGVALTLCETRLARQPLLSGIKHLNRLEQVLARSEWQSSEYFEGVVRDTQGYVIEGTMSNLFWLRENVWYTPSMQWAGVDGVIRQSLMTLIAASGIQMCEGEFDLQHVLGSESVLICNSLIDVIPVNKIVCGGRQHQFSISPMLVDLQKMLQAFYREENEL